MSEKVKKILFEKLPIAMIAVALSFVIFSAIATPTFVELIKLRGFVGAS